MPQVKFEKEGKTITCNAGNNLRKLAKRHGVNVYSGIWNLLNCRGNGLCGSCEVEVVSEAGLSPRTRMEEVQLKDKPQGRRLSCQVVVHGDMLIRTHPPKWAPLPDLKEDKKETDKAEPSSEK